MGTEGIMLKAKMRSAKILDQEEGLKPLLEQAEERFLRLQHLWLDGAYKGKSKGKGRVAQARLEGGAFGVGANSGPKRV